MKLKSKKVLMGLGFFSLTLLAACGNDNPEPTAKVTIDVAAIKKQMGIAPNPSIVAGEGVDSEIQALVIGTLTIQETDTPWTNDLIKSGVLTSVFGQDLRNSENYFTIFHLPISEDALTIELPPQNSKHFQIVAVGLRTKPSTVREIGVGSHAGSAVYFGFSELFFNTNEVANGSLHISMKRGCLVSPTPDGCAVFGALVADDPIVTESVEILGVKVNDSDYTTYAANFPMIVSTTAQATTAITYLKAVRDEIVATGVDISSLSVVTSHRTSTVESADCQDLVNQTDYYNTLHKVYCEMQEYKVSY
ncbi:MAG: hypothetical protein QNL04_05445 [SAR324 cluster bacterium]|nr:hypothetical protein [SAR324 cluster bacterium]